MSDHSASPSGSVPRVSPAENRYEPVEGETAELYSQNQGEETLMGVKPLDLSESEEVEYERRQKLPWWKRPSPVWLLVVMPVSAATMSSMTAPRIEIYTTLACNTHKPEYSSNHLVSFGSPPLNGSLVVPFHLAFDNVYFNDSIKANDTDDNEEKHKLCVSDPVVQAAVAQLSVVMTASVGILSCITTAWWGSVSDRRGRTFVLGIHMIGLLLTDFIFIFVSLFAKHVRGGYWFFVLGPIAEGILGGLASTVAAVHAYMADCTPRSSRSQIFSLSLGLIFTGTAVGPTVGGLIIRATKQTLSVFYVAMAVHLMYTILLWCILPESLSRAQMAKSLVKHRETQGAIAREWEESVGGMKMLVGTRRAFGFLSPLSIFWPHAERQMNPLKGWGRDWGLTLLMLAYGFTVSIMGSETTKFQYAMSTFEWSSEILGYWLTLVGITKAMYLTLILPVIIKYVKPKPASIRRQAEPGESTPLLASTSSTHAAPTSQTPISTPKPLYEKELHSAAFDLGLARVSLFIEVISYTFMALIPTPVAFTVFAMMGSLGTGFSPAVQSVTLEIYSRRGGTETGRLFGALSVVQALCSGILGPAMFGFTYMKTVATFPRTFLFLIVATVTISFTCLILVRLPNKASVINDGEDMLRDGETTLFDVGVDDEEHGPAVSKSIAIFVTDVDA